jgi:hypothetical protein
MVMARLIHVAIEAQTTPRRIGSRPLWIQAHANEDFEQGYNTDYRPQQFDEGNTAIFNYSISVADVPVTYCEEQYWEFRLDLNEHDIQDRDLITLTELALLLWRHRHRQPLTNYDPDPLNDNDSRLQTLARTSRRSHRRSRR